MNPAPPPEAPGGGDAWARDRLAAVAYIASLIGHEARNRFASLRAALELLEAGLEANLSPEYRRTLLRELDLFVGDFNLGLDMMRCNCGVPERISVREVVADAVAAIRPQAARAGIRLAPVFRHVADVFRTDRRLLRLILLNLLRNAVDALPGAAEPRIELRTRDDSAWMYFEIEDNGPGVPPALRERLFLRMPADREAGAGLGLSLCRDALVVLGGSISLADAAGRPGACFQVRLPLGK